MSTATYQEIKGYELQEVLGEGGFGIVYRAYQPLVKREVAIKVIQAALSNHPEFVRRFEAEAQLVARLEHLHIVPLYDYWRDPSGAYLVMRLLRGGSLQESIHSGEEWTLDDVVRLMDQMGSALSTAHQVNIIHQDLKPGNILLDKDRNAYLCDFGIAKDLGQEGILDDVAGAMVGTPAYVAPEQIQGGDITAQTDIYSLALVLFEVLTGQLAFQDSSISGLIIKQLTEPVPLLSSIRRDLPPGIDEVIQTATSKDPAGRYPDMMAFAKAFRQAALGKQSGGRRKQAFETSDLDQLVVVPSQTSFIITPDLLDIEIPATVMVNPYKGLRPFQEGDASDFYGRDILIQTLLDRMQEPSPEARFLAVVGPSGSGKSSVVKAGVIPALRRGALPNSQKFFISEMVPSVDALIELENSLLSIAINPPADLSTQLRASTTGLFDVVNAILPDDNSEFFLLIDQFEEVFTQTEDNAVRVHFIESLRYAVTHPQSRMRAVITIRADFYDRPLLYPEFGNLVRARTEVVLPLSKEELRDAISRPAEHAGALIEDELINRIIAEVHQEPGTLPLLQYALTELFERRQGRLLTLQSYLDTGGVLGSLARRAEELYEGMNAEQQEALRQLFLRLVTLGEGTEDTRRRVLWSELVLTDEHDDPTRYVLDSFGSKYRLLTFDRDPQTREPSVEVAHEALIRQWGRLRKWLEDSREDIRTQRRLSASVTEWQNASKDHSFLADGVRLNQFEQLASSSDIALTGDELGYIQASVDKRERLAREETARKKREEVLKERIRKVLYVLVAVMAVALIGSIYLMSRARSAEQDAKEQTKIAKVQRDVAERKTRETLSLNLAQQAQQMSLSVEDPFDILTLAMEANRIDNPPAESQQTLADVVWRAGPVRRLEGHEGIVWRAAFSPDGSTIASAGIDKTIILWDAHSGEQLRVLNQNGEGHSSAVITVRFSPDGTKLITSSWDQAVVVWDLATGEPTPLSPNPTRGSYAVMFSPDGLSALAASEDGILYRWDLASGNLTRFTGHTAEIYGLAVTPDSLRAVTASFDGSVRVWNLQTGEEELRFTGHNERVFAVAVSPDGQTVISGGLDNRVILWNINTGTIISTLSELPGEGYIRDLAFSPDGSEFLVSQLNNHLLLYNTETLKLIYHFSGHSQRINSVGFSPNGQFAVTAANDSTIVLWDVRQPGTPRANLHTFSGHTDAVTSEALNADGTRLLSGSADGSLIVWDTQSGEQISQWAASAEVDSVALSADGQTALSGAADGSVIAWNTATGTELRRFEGLVAPVRAVVFSPDESLIAAGGGYVQIGGDRTASNTIIVWDATTGTERYRLEGHQAPVRSLAWSGQILLSGSDDATMILWNAANGTQIRQFSGGHTDSVWAVAFSPDGTSILSGSRDKLVIWWDVASGTIKNVLRGHEAGVRSVVFSPNGQFALSSSGDTLTNVAQDNSLLLWDLSTSGDIRPIRRFIGHQGPVSHVVFAPDSETAYSASYDGTLISWRIETLDELIDWVYTNFDIYCYQGEGFGENDRCEKPVVQEAAEVKPTIPIQTPTPTTASQICSVENPSPLSIDPVDTTAYIAEAPYTIGFSNAVTSNSSMDAFVGAWAQYEATQHAEIENFIYTDAGDDVQQQAADIRSFIEQDVDLIIVNPSERGEQDLLVAPLTEAMDAGIPVVVVNKMVNYSTDTTFNGYVTFVGPDEFQVGCAMTQELITLIDGEGGVLRLDGVNLAPSRETRRNGANAIFDSYPDVNFTEDLPTDLQSTKTIGIVRNSLANQTRGLWAYNGQMALIGEQTLEENGRRLVPVVSDHNIGLVRFVLDNDLNASFVRVPSRMGADAVQVALQILNGEQVPHFIAVQAEVLHSSDLEQADLTGPDTGLLGDYDGLPEEFWPESE